MSNDLFDYNRNGKLDITEQQIQAKVYRDSYNKNRDNHSSSFTKNVNDRSEKKNNKVYIWIAIATVIANLMPNVTALIVIPFAIYIVLKWCFS